MCHRYLLFIAILLPSLSCAQEYRYGEAWWHEPREDADTALLLHFGAPMESTVEAAIKKSDQQRADSADLFADPPASTTTAEVNAGDRRPAAINEAHAPTGTVFDYSSNRRQFKLGDGFSLVPDGRFGSALNCAGKNAFVLPDVVYKDGTGAAVDCWIKVAAYPQKPACVWEVLAAHAAGKVGDSIPGAQLLLHPDGRLQLKLRHPHGAPYNAKPELLKILDASPGAVLFSKKPAPLNEWLHVLCFNRPPVVQGGGSPMGVFFVLNGVQQASFISEKNNAYNFLGDQLATWYLGNSRDATQAFTGQIDEFRVLQRLKQFYPVAPAQWSDREAKNPVRFGRPWFLADGAVFHASLDKGLDFDFHKGDPQAKIELVDKGGGKPEAIEVPGVRGKAWVIDPTVGLVRLPIKGLNAANGTLEFWLRPENFDNYTGACNKLPPNWQLSAVRLFGKDSHDTLKKFVEFHVPRARDLANPVPDFQPGEWRHIALEWGNSNRAFLQGAPWTHLWRAEKDVLDHIEPLYAEFGICDDVKVVRDQAPRIVIDEIAGYNYSLAPREIKQAMNGALSEIQPIPLYEARPDYKRSIHELSFELTSLLPDGETPGSARVSFANAAGTVLAGPFEKPFKDGKAFFLIDDAKPIEAGKYRFIFQMTNAAGATVVDEKLDWEYAPEAWVGCTAGILDTPPAPWTPIEFKDGRVQTRMTTYVLDDSGLPRQIIADGVELLTNPVQLLEDGKPLLSGEKFKIEENKPVSAAWTSTFKGRTCDIAVRWSCEYDGMVRYELTLTPKAAAVAPIRLVFPLHDKLATRFMSHTAGKGSVDTDAIENLQGVMRTSSDRAFGDANWEHAKKKLPPLKREEFEGYGFWCMADLHDHQRGLYWFADHAKGWRQSKKIPAQLIERQGSEVRLVCNLVAEPVALKNAETIVFGILPHPARPIPERYRQLERIDAKIDPLYCGAYASVFTPWPMEPRGGQNMRIFPAADPENSEGGPSFEYAEKCAANFQIGGMPGFRTMYLSKFWLSCRAGTYDGWEWRGGPTGQATLTPRFVDYLCWEMNEFIRRGIYNAIYLDETYCTPSTNVKAGQAILLPDGTIQAGEQNWATRELFKRWRNIFHQNGKTPMVLSHLTGAFPYHALVFCDSYLDGEGAPIVTATSRDFIDAVALHRLESCQNGALWGVIPFYMVCIWEGGLERGKDWNPRTRWSWRMARQAMALLAHFENGETYTDQGSAVYTGYWNDVLSWGAGDLKSAECVPYWRTEKYFSIEGTPKDALVSFYKQNGKVLLIASNLANAPKELRIKLNRQALGLPASAAAKSRDASYKPAEGLDVESKQQKVEAEKPKEDDLVELINSDSKPQRDATEPRIENDVLIIPVRAKDFRLIAIE